jgi:hypothetical protein
MQPGVVRRARAIERGMPGEPVSPAAWRIAFGEASGAVAASDQRRILAALREAERLAPFVEGRRARRFTCDRGG